VFIFSLLADSTLSHYQNLGLEGNPLGLVIDSGLKSMIVSVDSAHEPGSTFQLRSDGDAAVQPLQIFQKIDSGWVKSPLQFNIGSEAALSISDGNKTGGRNLSDLMYPIEKLRKIGGED
jgi:hypothetical protein